MKKSYSLQFVKKSVTTTFATLLLLSLAMFFPNTSNSQQYTMGVGTSNNAYPLNSATVNRVQWLVLNSDFTPSMPQGPMLITKVYFRINGGPVTYNYTRLEVKLLATPITTLTAGRWENTTSVFSSASYTGTTTGGAGGFFVVTLPTPFPYNPATENLVVDLSQQGYSTGITVNQIVAPSGNRRIWGTPTGAAPTGADANHISLGLDMLPATPCTGQPVAGAIDGFNGICQNMGFDLMLKGNTVAAKTEYQWQESDLGKNNWSNISNSDAPAISVPKGISSAKSYRAIIKCLSSDLSDTTPVHNMSINLQLPGGTYTIDPKGSGANNYTSFAAAFNRLRCGTTGPVTFNIASGTYTEQLELEDFYLAKDRVATFQSATGNPNDVTLQFTGTGTTNNYVVKIGTNAAFVTFKNMTIRNNGTTYAQCVWITNHSSDIVFDNVSFYGYASATTSVDQAIVRGESNMIYNFYAFRNSRFYGGSSAFYLQATANANGFGGASQNFTVENCELKDQYYYGFYGYYLHGIQFKDNIVTTTRNYTNYYGIYLYWNVIPDPSNRGYVQRNRFYHQNSGHGMFCSYWGVNSTCDATKSYVISDNIIDIGSSATTGQTRGMYMDRHNGSMVYHNTINISTSSGSNSAAYWLEGTYTTNINPPFSVKNNLFTVSNSGSAMRRGGTNFSATNFESDNNNFYSPNLNTVTNMMGNDESLAEWNKEGYDFASTTIYPEYKKTTHPNPDFSFQEPDLNDIVPFESMFKTDINGRVRKNTAADPGAIEMNHDLYLVSATIPNVFYCSNDKPEISVRIDNIGELTAKTISIKVTSNAGVNYTDVINTPLTSGSSTSFKLPTPIRLQGGMANQITVEILGIDDNLANNKITFNSPFVEVSPSGGVLTVANSNLAIEPTSSTPYWVTIPGENIEFAITKPSAYSNSDYNQPNGFGVQAIAYTKNSGIALPSSASQYTHSSSGGKWVISVPESFTDSLVTFEVKFKNNVSGCDTSFKQDVLIAPYGKPDFATHAACSGEDVEFENFSQVQSGYLTYSWDFGNGKESSNTNGITTYPSTGTYTVTLTATTVPYGFVKSVKKTVSIKEAPIADFDYTSKCFGSPVNLTNKTISNSGTPKYSWDFGDGQTSSQTSPTVNYFEMGLYVVTLTADYDGCVTTKEHTVAMFEKPNADFDLVSGSCANSEFLFDNTTTDLSGKAGYLWSFGENNAGSTQSSPSYIFQTPGSKSVKMIVSTALGCKDSITKNVNVLPGPSADFSIVGNCQDGDISFTSLDAAPVGTTFGWNIDGVIESGVNNVSKKYASVGIRTATLEVHYANGCENVVSKEFEVKPTPKADFVVGNSLCANDDILIENKTQWTDGQVLYTWDLGDGGNASTQHPTHNYDNAGNYSVKLTATIINGCEDAITKTVTINPSPKKCDFNINYNGDKGLRSYTFEPTDGTNAGAESGVSYSWYYGNGNQNNLGETDYSYDGTYKITMIAKTSAGCDCEVSKELVINRTSVDNVVENVSFQVYPNPSTGLFKVEVENTRTTSKVEVFDVIGNKVFDFTNTEMDAMNWTIDLGSFSNGVYLIRYSSEDQISTKKVRLVK